MIRILASDGIESAAAEALAAKGFEVVNEHYEAEELAAKIADFDCILVRSATKVRTAVIDAAAASGRLKLIVRGGVGVDNIDVDYAEGKGITVRNTPAASSASVAELVIGHMFCLARHIHAANVTMHEGKWEKKKYEGCDLAGKTLGLIGLGRIGRLVAEKAAALGMDIIYTDVVGALDGVPYRYGSAEEVLRAADFLTLHVPACEWPVIGAEQIALMKDGAYIVNTARGGLIDYDALFAALDSGKLAGAALDVFPEEPPADERFASRLDLSLTPHIGASTKEAQERIGGEIVSIVSEFFA
ncbi:MAG: D-2-hydroxyacid dehydrogenase [Clostridiales Family XIII bacterium]|jgi:D-3-phosphoglycerate dehydrogenase|nr:D-2-hydroxyacid dehydrogenase [Clostridiales Family XIII bacterium]